MIVLAITGGIGSGKSTVRRMFEELGAIGIDADELARQVVQSGSEGARLLEEAFGPTFFDSDGNLDRKQMARKVFADKEARHTIESLLHPLIRSAEKKVLEQLKVHKPNAVVVIEIPLLAEGGRAEEYDHVVLVTAPEEVRMSRLIVSGKYTKDEAAARIANQAADGDRKSVADWIVDNSDNMDVTEQIVKTIYRSLATR
jgi:dephospho-CoA kinase